MPGYVSTLQEDLHISKVTKPWDGGSQTRLWQLSTGSDFDIEDFQSSGQGMAIGDQVFPLGVTRTGRCINIRLMQVNRNTVREVIEYDDNSEFSLGSSTDAQNTDPSGPGYINTDVRATEASGTFWRYASPSAFEDGGVGPWETADVPDTYQCLLEEMTTKVCDLGGVPMTVPVAQEELVITTTWESNAAATTYRARWRGLIHARNNANWLGYPQGTLLFAGGSTRSSGRDAMPVSDLRFVYDPYGYCRQRAVSDANGAFSEDYLVTVASPVPDEGDCDDEDAPDQLHAKYVYWVQLFQTLSDFDSLITTSQKSIASDMLT